MKKDERKKNNLRKIGEIRLFDQLWSDSLARVKSALKVPVASLSEGDVSQASYKAIGSKREAFENFQIGRHLEKFPSSLHID